MSQNVTSFPWDRRSRRAAVRLADDVLTDEQIAFEAGITRRQLNRWKDNPTFAACVQAISLDFEAATKEIAIADKRLRLHALDDLFQRQYQVIEERATEYAAMARQRAKEQGRTSDLDNLMGRRSVPAGGTSGMITRQVKTQGPLVIEEFADDTALVKSLLDIMKQAAQETGQWEAKVGVKHSGHVTHDHRFSGHEELDVLSVDDLDRLKVIRAKIDTGLGER